MTGDFNNDGTIDVATSADTFKLLLPPIQIADFPSIPPQPPADFTSDGIVDQISIPLVSGWVTVQPGRGDVTFGDPIYSPVSGLTARRAEVKGDSKKEADETFCLEPVGLSSNALLTKSRGTSTILNDD